MSLDRPIADLGTGHSRSSCALRLCYPRGWGWGTGIDFYIKHRPEDAVSFSQLVAKKSLLSAFGNRYTFSMELYNKLRNFLLTEQERWENGYPDGDMLSARAAPLVKKYGDPSKCILLSGLVHLHLIHTINALFLYATSSCIPTIQTTPNSLLLLSLLYAGML